MAEPPTKEQLGRLRWLSIGALVALFVADYGFDIFQKSVPNTVYFILGSIALGIDVAQLRALFIVFLKSWLGQNSKDDKK